MQTIQQLKTFARKELELSDDYVRQFGPLTRKLTWEKAIANWKDSRSQTESELFALVPLAAPCAITDISSFLPPAPVSVPSSIPLPEPEEEPEEEPVVKMNNPSDLPDPQTINLEKLKITEVSPHLPGISSLFSHDYKDYEVWMSIFHKNVVGGAIVAPDKSRAWTFTTGYLGNMDNCYASDWVVSKWFSKLSHRIIDDWFVDLSKKRKPLSLVF